jgi:hypothetical protein
MTLKQLKEKYPFISKCVDVHEGVEYLNPKKVQKLMNEELNRDIENFQGYILIDSNDMMLDGDDIILNESL